jgi:hypothetical protein
MKLKKLSKLINLESFTLNNCEFSVEKTYVDDTGALYQKCECGGACACCKRARKPANLYLGNISDINIAINFN